MNKKANTILFILGATVFNVVVMIAVFIALFVLYGQLIAESVPPQVNQIVVLVLFIGSIALTYFIYHKVIQWAQKKWDLEKYFDPIFGKKK